MKTPAPAWFKFLPAEWLDCSDVIDVSIHAQGTQLLLMMRSWGTDGLPVDSESIRRRVGMVDRQEWELIWAEIECYWPVVDGRRRNALIEDIRSRAAAEAERMRGAGRKGGLESARKRSGVDAPVPTTTGPSPVGVTPTAVVPTPAAKMTTAQQAPPTPLVQAGEDDEDEDLSRFDD